MIKLTLHRQSTEQNFLFTKECISIGEGQSDSVDISLPGLGLHQNHIKILLIGNWYYISNQANDPFITLNGLPFGKKKLKSLDAIKIKDCVLTIDEIQLVAAQESITEPINLEEQLHDFPNAEKFAKEDDFEGWFPTDLSELNIEDIAKIDERKQHKAEDQDQEEQNHETKYKKSLFSLKKLKWIAVFIALLLIVISAVGAEAYFRAASKSGVEESKAAESLADLAMALTYAKVFQVIPPNNNYSDPEFLKTNLTSLLPSNSILSGTVDSKGMFSNCSYLFRFYSSHGLSRFLIIAQPAPSISQWLFPKDSILIDSALMDIRKISDLRIINSLLAASKPFESSNGRELAEAIKNLKVLPLPQLAKISKKIDFAPPKILKYFKPGAENLIYNSPRYYLFTEPLLKKLLNYDFMGFSTANVSSLMNELERFALFDNLIIYTTEGLQAAYRANKALYKANTQANFISAYLLLSATNEILSSRLLLDTKESDGSFIANESEIAEAEGLPKKYPFTHPINEKFDNFKIETAKILLPFLKQMDEVLKENIQKNDFSLGHEFFNLLENYQKEKFEQKEKLTKMIKNIQNQFSEITTLEIYQYLKTYELETLTDLETYKPPLSFLLPPFLPKKNETLRLPAKI